MDLNYNSFHNFSDSPINQENSKVPKLKKIIQDIDYFFLSSNVDWKKMFFRQLCPSQEHNP